jgi:hypothetical protein
LLNIGIIKKTSNGSYCLYDYEDQPSYWDKIQQKCLKAGGPLIDLKVRKLVLGDQDPVTGWYETDYDTGVSIRGIVVHKGAIELRAAVSNLIPVSGDYSAILLTKGSLDEGDHLEQGDDLYNVTEVNEIIDRNKFSFWVAKLINIPK